MIEHILRGLLGLVVLLGLAYLFSSKRSAVRIRVIFWGVGLQLLFAFMILSKQKLSFGAMFIFLVMILVYVYGKELNKLKSILEQVTASLFIFLCSGVAVILLYKVNAYASFENKAKLIGILFAVTVVLNIVGILIKNSMWQRVTFTGVLLTGYTVIVTKGWHGQVVFQALSDKVAAFLKLSDAGSSFMFGNLMNPEYFFPDTTTWPGFGFQFAFSVLPTIIFFASFISILYYLGIIQFIIDMMAKFMRWTMGTSGAETLSCSANIFVGQTEAPFLIKPFIDDMTISEIHAVMVGGFATIAGGVLAGYIRMGIDPGHLIAASVMSAPAALVIAKLLVPETEHSKTAGDVDIPHVKIADNLLDAAARGVTDGLHLALNVGAMLIAFIALIAFVDVVFGFGDKWIDGWLLKGTFNEVRGEYSGYFPGSLKTLFGTIFRPLAWCLGVPWGDSFNVGNLMGIKIAVNEFVGYKELSDHIIRGDLSPKAVIISTYALCGFANFSSIGIQIGGIGALAPGRRSELAKVGLKAMFGGALASWMTATIAGMFL